MLRNRILAAIATAGLTVAVSSSPAFAAEQPPVPTRSIVQELKVRAVVPAHRDIVVDLSGKIVRITSNTPEDVAPTVYTLEATPSNRKPLTDELYKQYREHVPKGTAAYGVLYERQARTASIGIGSLLAAKTPFDAS